MKKDSFMKTCDTCGNHYDKCFEIITANNQKYTFDCFECAIYQLAPCCSHCECKIIGHGLEEKNYLYCCNHCAKKAGSTGLKDRNV